ncbi:MULTISPECIES: glycosyltransferase [unclassified Fusibacter]|uniref:MGDG synthase family glycosyltransferase n=1 Tax=unclassified Fusibacter TaxID=2624464 RepID=UPI0010134214|nr:glycosyltransferase [Fusibacter sp. A1]MCK8058266.1 UDP-N-acetylglucosamine--LPS N-acetylglucosamine transferase [Fusibacter sp. A2]NPE20849.1 UDP-N-acetylglucosamine--LPS N-acetylglucosamine transferase [Fusibacter sp. A1]RXV63053.1 UDP-N-acetylglucosamine--LPS N-acetylglucosamine transferase [Fusibacter sp. A1]
MKNVLIVTASTGAGHNQAANNLKKEFEEKGMSVHIVDMFKTTSRGMNMIVADGYKILATKLPKTYGVIYKTADKKHFNRIIARNVFIATELRLKKVIRNTVPDLIISTHPFGAPIIGALKEKRKVDAPFIQIVTDFKAHYTYIHPYVDVYITASEYTKNSLVERGISKDKIFAYGIPTKDEFKVSKVRQFSSDKPFELLIMGGSMGLKPMEEAVKELLKIPERLKLTVVCGKNESLVEHLNKDLRAFIEDGHLKVLGFVDNVHELMEEADLIISKPGGLTTTEAINKCIPMIIPFAIPGQEQENTSFLVEHEMAIEVKDIKELHHHIKSLVDQPEYYQRMVNNMLDLSKSYSVDKIIDLAMDMMNEPARFFLATHRVDSSSKERHNQ